MKTGVYPKKIKGKTKFNLGTCGLRYTGLITPNLNYSKINVSKAFTVYTNESKTMWLKSQARCNMFLSDVTKLLI